MHMTGNREWIYNYEPAPVTTIKIADNKQLEVHGMGCVNITTNTDHKNNKIQVKNILFVPKLATNLLSVSQMTKNGCHVEFNDKGCNICQNSNIVLTAKRQNKMYVVHDAAYALHVSNYVPMASDICSSKL